MGHQTSGAANGQGRDESLSRWVSVMLVLALMPAAPAFAQAEAFVVLIPTELGVGAGSALEWDPGQASPDVNIGLSRAWVRDQWIEPKSLKSGDQAIAAKSRAVPWNTGIRVGPFRQFGDKHVKIGKAAPKGLVENVV